MGKIGTAFGYSTIAGVPRVTRPDGSSFSGRISINGTPVFVGGEYVGSNAWKDQVNDLIGPDSKVATLLATFGGGSPPVLDFRYIQTGNAFTPRRSRN